MSVLIKGITLEQFYRDLNNVRNMDVDWDIVQLPADVVSAQDFRDCRNELCLKCGQYQTRHLGSCNGCRWERINGRNRYPAIGKWRYVYRG